MGGPARNRGGTRGHGYIPLQGQKPNWNQHILSDKKLGKLISFTIVQILLYCFVLIINEIFLLVGLVGPNSQERKSVNREVPKKGPDPLMSKSSKGNSKLLSSIKQPHHNQLKIEPISIKNQAINIPAADWCKAQPESKQKHSCPSSQNQSVECSKAQLESKQKYPYSTSHKQSYKAFDADLHIDSHVSTIICEDSNLRTIDKLQSEDSNAKLDIPHQIDLHCNSKSQQSYSDETFFNPHSVPPYSPTKINKQSYIPHIYKSQVDVQEMTCFPFFNHQLSLTEVIQPQLTSIVNGNWITRYVFIEPVYLIPIYNKQHFFNPFLSSFRVKGD